ncbi:MULTISPECIES: glycosyltransferase [Lactobacillaceae]|uniref:glycosyltransferase n=1 Tax=Lactobacillaceae TaxID=33958 RepID=UPI00145754D0|nr:glycosyltransferase [Lactobacillus sp. HBUAS51381]NLR09050.1 glycosyltransferase [Lactobacillus sp. HBUAS51381]
MVTVVVMMSSYNGEFYISQQMRSILDQKGVNVEILIRDDGSHDKTLAVLDKFSRLDNVTVISGHNIGWRKSFMTLLEKVRFSSEVYYAFSDQDDIWKADKLMTAVGMLKKNIPMVYHSNVTTMTDNETVIGNRFSQDFEPSLKMPECFLNGYGVGATMVFNSQMLSLLRKHRVTQETNHDAYVMALGNLMGGVVYDKRSHILYRRHAGTATGFGKSESVNAPTLWVRYKRYKKNPKNVFSHRAEQILDGYSDELSDRDKKLLHLIAGYKSNFLYRLELFFSPKFKATGFRKTLQIKYRVGAGTL